MEINVCKSQCPHCGKPARATKTRRNVVYPYRVDYILPSGRFRYKGNYSTVPRALKAARGVASSLIIATITRRSDGHVIYCSHPFVRKISEALQGVQSHAKAA